VGEEEGLLTVLGPQVQPILYLVFYLRSVGSVYAVSWSAVQRKEYRAGTPGSLSAEKVTAHGSSMSHAETYRSAIPKSRSSALMASRRILDFSKAGASRPQS